jgi:hypothetical protein
MPLLRWPRSKQSVVGAASDSTCKHQAQEHRSMADHTAPGKAVLDFSTIVTGLPIRIDGELYEIRHPDSLPLGVIKRLEAQAPVLGALLQRTDLTKAEEQDASALLRQMVSDVMNAPEDVQQRLHEQHRLMVLEAFTQLRATKNQTTPGANANPGMKLSRGSRASTAARRKSGSGESR